MGKISVYKYFKVFLLVMSCMANVVSLSQSKEKLLEKANEGDASAQYSLGYYYYRNQQYEDATFWLEKSNTGFSQSLLGRMYQNGNGVSKSFEKAIYYYDKYLKNAKRVTKKDGWLYDTRSEMLGIAQCYDSLGNYGEALKWYHEICYGKYDKDMEHSNEWDCASAIVGMIRLYHLGLGVEKSPKMVQELLMGLYGDRNISKFAQNAHYYASDYMRNPSTPENCAMVLFWLDLGARYGSAEAIYLQGDIYENGLYGVTKDLDKAVELYKTAMEGGCANAFGRFGVLCYDGVDLDGLAKLINSDAAYSFLRVAEIKGVKDPDVALRLSYCYRDGYGTDIDPEKQKYWETKAAEWGSQKARDWLLQDIEKRKKEEREKKQYRMIEK